MTNIQSFNRIIFYGCSFTAGAELADQELLPNNTKEEIDNLKRAELHNFYKRFDNKLREKLEKEKSWARWFADEICLQYENRAKSGSSMAQIIFSIEQDLARNFIKDTDIIVVGTTSPDRICRFMESGAKSIILNNSYWENKWSNSFEREFLINIANDNYLLFNWYKELRYLDLLSSRLNGRLLQQWVWATWEQLLDFNFYKVDQYMSDILHPNITFESFIDNKLSFTTLDSWNPINHEVLLHPKLEVQKQFAKMLANSLKSKVSWCDK